MPRPYGPGWDNRWRSTRATTTAQYVVLVLLVVAVVVIAAALLYDRLNGDASLTLLNGAG